LRANRGDEYPTLDPVELERRLIAETRASVEHERRSVRWPLLSRLAVLFSLALVGVYLVAWAGSVQNSGGPEDYVRRTDFVSTLAGAQIVRDGGGPLVYNLDIQRAVSERITAPAGEAAAPFRPYIHLPFEALLVGIIVEMPLWFSFAVWTLAAGLCMGVAVGLMDSALPVSRYVGWVLSLAACSYLPVIRSLMLGQDSAFVLLGLCGTFVSLKRGSNGWAALSLLLVALKPQILPVVLLLLLLLRHMKAIALFVGLVAALSVAAMGALGADWPLDYFRLLINGATWQANATDPTIMHNWHGFAANLFGGVLPGLVLPLVVVLSLASAAALVWAWTRSITAEPPDDDEPDYEPGYDLLWALAGIVAVLISFYLNPHDLTLLVFPAWILGAYATSGLWGVGRSRLWIALLWAGYIVAPIALTLNPAANLPGGALPVVLSVLLMAFAGWLLVRQPHLELYST
jgi:hypothetical protein